MLSICPWAVSIMSVRTNLLNWLGIVLVANERALTKQTYICKVCYLCVIISIKIRDWWYGFSCSRMAGPSLWHTFDLCVRIPNLLPELHLVSSMKENVQRAKKYFPGCPTNFCLILWFTSLSKSLENMLAYHLGFY